MADKKLNVLGIAGSLRKGSYNRMLLNAASELMPEEAVLEKFDLDGIPVFNQDLENDVPEAVRKLKSRISGADAVLIVTPEYNYSVPGMLKNAIDWASRPYGDNSFRKKPVGIMSASPGMLGGSRAQYHLRQTMLFLDAFAMVRPEVFVTFADKKFDAGGKLTDPDTVKHVGAFLESLIKWSKAIMRVSELGLL